MNWSEVAGKRLGLVLIADELETPAGGIVYGVVRKDGDEFVLDRGAGRTPFRLQPEWCHRVMFLSEVSDRDTLNLIGDVDCFLTLSVGPLPKDVGTDDLIATGFNWNDFPEDTSPAAEP